MPLTENNDISKEVGTRHRAGVGIAEVSDSLTIIVSEQSGKISVADDGELERNFDGESLKARLMDFSNNINGDVKTYYKSRTYSCEYWFYIISYLIYIVFIIPLSNL